LYPGGKDTMKSMWWTETGPTRSNSPIRRLTIHGHSGGLLKN